MKYFQPFLYRKKFLSGWKFGYFSFVPITILLIFAVLVAGQHNTSTFSAKALYERADYLYNLENPTEESDEEALHLFVSIASIERSVSLNRLRIESMIKAGNIHQGYSRFPEANDYYHKALRENSALNNWPEYNYEAYLYLGSSMYFNGKIDSAKFYFEKTAEISVAFRNKLELPEQDRLYNSLGAIYYESADYNQAINFFLTALELGSPRIEDYNNFYMAIKSNIASCLMKLKFYDSSIGIYNALIDKSLINNLIFHNLAHAYFEKGDLDSALSIYTSVSFKGEKHSQIAYNDIGRIYLKKGNLEAAKLALDSASMLIGSKGEAVKNKEEALTHLYLSELSQKLGNIEDAIMGTNKALSVVHLNFTSKSKYDLPEDVGNTVSPITFYQILTFKAGLIYEQFKTNNKKETLIAALNTYIKAFQTVNYIARNFDNDDAKLFLLSTAKNNYEHAMEIAYQAAKLDEVQYASFLYVLESYKGTILRQNLAVNSIKKIAGIPDSIINKESNLKQLYAAYLTKINLATSEEESKGLQNRLTELRLELSTLQTSFEQYQLYSRINESDQFDIPLKEVQKALDNETVLLNYFVGEKDIYLMAITRKFIRIHKTKATNEYENALNAFMTASLNLTEGSRYKGYEAGNLVFKALIEPVYTNLTNHKKMIIIPDDYLFYLPFDALDRTPGNKDYLVRSHAIVSHYSVSLLMQHNAFNPRSKNPDSVTAFAPFVLPDLAIAWTGLDALPFSADEINNPRTVSYKGNEATKDQFMQSYNQRNILHLATHASLGEDSSTNWIQLYPDKDSSSSGRLFVHEIYNLDLTNNNLVILSACESGAGLSTKGEGLLSLSRAFMYAGSKGIISTLYKTDDRVTAFLMKRLYSYLDKGFEPALALQKSKIDLLDSDEINARFKSPNYWGNFVYIGKVSTHYEITSYWWILIPVVLMISGSIWWFRKNLFSKPD